MHCRVKVLTKVLWLGFSLERKRETVTSGCQQEHCAGKGCAPLGDMPGVAVVATSLDSCFETVETNPPLIANMRRI